MINQLRYLLRISPKYLPSPVNLVSGIAQAAKIIAPLFIHLRNDKSELDVTSYATDVNSIEKEREDILFRANWLCDKILVSPKDLLNSYPPILGPKYGPEWSIYSCVMLISALSNIIRIWPEYKSKCLYRIERLVELLQSEELKRYDAKEWGEDPIESLDGNKSHVTYLSILAWALSLYRLSGGSDKYDSLYCRCCEAMNRRMLRHKDLNLLSFPNKPIFLPDMLVAIVALKNYSKIFDNRYEDIVHRYISNCKTLWQNKRTGLIVAMLYGKRKTGVRGCYTALNNYWLTLIDDQFAYDQFRRMKKYLYKKDNITGIKEFTYKEPELSFDPNAGPIYKGFSPSGTAYAIGSATYFNDWEFRNEMLASANKAGGIVEGQRSRHYKLAEFALVGEAVVLAMRTNFKFES